MTRTAKILSWSVGIFVGLIGITVGAAYLFVTSDYVRGELEGRASAFSGHKTKIGKISIDWGSTTHVHLDDVEVANANWGKADHMVKAGQIDFDIRLWPLLHGNFVLPHLTLRKPEIDVETNDQDQSNWSFTQSPVANAAAKAVAPSDRFQVPLIGQLEIVDGRLGYKCQAQA